MRLLLLAWVPEALQALLWSLVKGVEATLKLWQLVFPDVSGIGGVANNDGLEIHENDILGMVDGKVLVSTPDMDQALLDTRQMVDEDRWVLWLRRQVVRPAQALTT